MNGYKGWELKYPNYVVIRKEGYLYRSRNESAIVLSKIMNYNLGKTMDDEYITGGPNIDIIVEKLFNEHVSFVVIRKDVVIYENRNADFNLLDYIKEASNKSLSTTTREDHKREDNLLDFALNLRDGFDPRNGEVFESNHIMRSDYMLKILNIAIKRLKYKEIAKPDKSGSKWSKSEDEMLKKAYMNNVSIKEIALNHKRTRGAIESRLIKLYPHIVDISREKTPS